MQTAEESQKPMVGREQKKSETSLGTANSCNGNSLDLNPYNTSTPALAPGENPGSPASVHG